MIKYKIVEIDEAQHSIVVRYYTDAITEEMLAVDVLDGVIRRCRTDYSMDLPIPAPTGPELHTFIALRAPRDWLLAQENIVNPYVDTSLTKLIPLLNIEVCIEEHKEDPTAL